MFKVRTTYRVKVAGGHTHLSIWADGGHLGSLCVRNEEIEVLDAIVSGLEQNGATNNEERPKLQEFTAMIASDSFWVTYKVRALDEEKAREMLEHECDHCQGADERAGEIGRAATYSIRKIEHVGPADADEVEADITQIDAGGNG